VYARSAHIPHRQSVVGQKLFEKVGRVAAVADPPLEANTLRHHAET
jgi:hypothetical protein